MFPIVNIGPLALQAPGLIILAGIWAATMLFERDSKRSGLASGTVLNMVFLSLVAGIIGARLGYALKYIDIYLSDPLGLFSLNMSTLGFVEGIVTAFLAALIYSQRKGLPLWTTLDVLTPGLALFSIFLGFSHGSSGEAFGALTSVPWAIDLWGAMRHPSQIYEMLFAGLIFLLVQRVKHSAPFSGFTFFFLLVCSGGSRLFLEAFRGDSTIILGSVRSAQVLSLGVILVGLLGMHILAKGTQPEE